MLSIFLKFAKIRIFTALQNTSWMTVTVFC